ncbi:MAG: cupin domain-containing protein [Chloroflexota bacterium]|nr:cupin domain-containing protein [Chloroflexota bacterium]
MIVRRVKDVEAINVGKLLNIPDMVITLRWLVHNQVGDESYGHRFAFRHFTIEPGKSYPMHYHKYVEAVYVVSGKCVFQTNTGEVEMEAGDLAYTSREEPHAMKALGDEPVTFICCIDCVNGGENCTQVIPK